MNIILFHSGKSKQKKKKNGEAAELLTKEGAKRVASAAGGLDRIIPRKVKIQVWSSMSGASSQTADIIAEELGVKRKYLKTLDTDDLTTILNTAFEHGNGECIILVSHQPFLSDWAKKLTGLKLPFTDATAACLDIDPEKPLKAELIWYIKPKYLKNIG